LPPAYNAFIPNKSEAVSAMFREVVYRHGSPFLSEGVEANDCVNVNDEIGLDSFLSYTLPEYLSDLAEYDDIRVVHVTGNTYSFSNGSSCRLEQRTERIPLEALDSETIAVLVEGCPCLFHAAGL
jgi:hypothetical protein